MILIDLGHLIISRATKPRNRLARRAASVSAVSALALQERLAIAESKQDVCDESEQSVLQPQASNVSFEDEDDFRTPPEEWSDEEDENVFEINNLPAVSGKDLHMAMEATQNINTKPREVRIPSSNAADVEEPHQEFSIVLADVQV